MQDDKKWWVSQGVEYATKALSLTLFPFVALIGFLAHHYKDFKKVLFK